MIIKSLKNIISVAIILIAAPSVFAQQHSQSDLPELTDPKPKDLKSWSKVSKTAGAGFGSVNTHYGRSSAPVITELQSTWKKKAWKGERVHTQVLLYSKKLLKDVQLEVTELKAKGSKESIAKENVQANFVRYVMTSYIGNLKQGCDIQIKVDSSLRADIIDNKSMYSVADSTTRPIWLSIDIPADAKTGTYSGRLKIKASGYQQTLPFEIDVLEHRLPAAKDWSFHLDLWQNPYSDARVAGVELWSKAHFDVMRPVYQRLASAGQKVITSTLIHDPWKSQTYDVYGGMIKWIKKNDGSWTYDFSAFDKWVEFMMSLGIDKQINAYGMIPWTLEYTYYDEATGENKIFKASPETTEYATYWGSMLSSFAEHLTRFIHEYENRTSFSGLGFFSG